MPSSATPGKTGSYAARLEKALAKYTPPKGMNLPQRNLVVFRDEDDFTLKTLW